MERLRSTVIAAAVAFVEPVACAVRSGERGISNSEFRISQFHQLFEPFDRERQVRTAFVAHYRMNFVDDQRARRFQHPAAAFAGQQNVKRFGSRDDDMRRTLRHRSALRSRCVTCSDQRANVYFRQAQRFQFFLNTFQWRLQVALDVVTERLQRRDVDDVRRVVEFSFNSEANEIVDRRHKRRECLTGTGRRGNQRVAMLLDLRPRVELRIGRHGESPAEPA